jgi:hypothetical protein
MVRNALGNYRVVLQTLVVVGALVALRAVLWAVGVEGLAVSPLASSIVAGGIFVMGLVVAGMLSDYRDAERAPTELAGSLYAIMREGEAMHEVWGKPDLPTLRTRLIAIVTALRADINAGDTRAGQAAIEDLSQTFLELEDTDVPANYIVRLRQEQAALRKAVLRIYNIQREQFLPSAHALILTFVVVILTLVLFTNFDGHIESLVTVGFLSFFFLSLLRLLEIIDKPFKVGAERTDDDVSLFLLNEFVVQAQAAAEGVTVVEEIEAQAEEVEEQLVEIEESTDDAADLTERATSRLAPDE